jgi:hypothetical protein
MLSLMTRLYFMLIPLGAILGLLGGPLWSAQATSITSISLAYAEHIHAEEQDVIINKMMGIFCGLYRLPAKYPVQRTNAIIMVHFVVNFWIIHGAIKHEMIVVTYILLSDATPTRIFCGLYRMSNIWGNLITTLVLGNNETTYDRQINLININVSSNSTCGLKI